MLSACTITPKRAAPLLTSTEIFIISLYLPSRGDRAGQSRLSTSQNLMARHFKGVSLQSDNKNVNNRPRSPSNRTPPGPILYTEWVMPGVASMGSRRRIARLPGPGVEGRLARDAPRGL